MCFATPGLPQGLRLDQDGFVAAYPAVPHEAVFRTLDRDPERIDNLKRFLNSMMADTTIDTVYKASYILATAMHEGRCAGDAWQMTWSPVSETRGGSTASYWNSVVVRNLAKVPLDKDGAPIEPLKDAHGASRLGRRHASAVSDADLPHYHPATKLISRTFNGRGYVQLTWLENYLTIGETIGMGNQLACNPDLVLEHDTAFRIAADGMRLGCFMGNRHHVEGQGRIGGHKLDDYGKDYVRARAIVNGGGDAAEDIARYATIFERLIQDNRLV